MKKLRWYYDIKSKYWYTLETVAWANDGWHILRGVNSYRLMGGCCGVTIGTFRKLKTAKQVAQLIHNG